MFKKVYEDAVCPLSGYESYTFRILVNPTGKEKTDWAFGNLGDPECKKCARDKAGQVSNYCPDCAALREQFGRASVAVYGDSKVAGFDFSTPAAALKTFSQDMPDEFLSWLYLAPGAAWAARAEQLKKMVSSPSGMNGASS